MKLVSTGLRARRPAARRIAGRRRRSGARPRAHHRRRDQRQDGRGPAHERPGDACLHQPDRRHQRARPGAERRPRHQPARAVRRVAARPRARHRPRARPAARHPGAGQGQPRRRRPADDGRQRGAPELDPGPRLDRRGQAARGRRGDPRQDEPDRVRELHDQRHAERLLVARRPGAQPVRHRPRHERLVVRLRLRGRRRPRADHDRHRDLGLDRQPRRAAGRGRPAAHGRARVADRHPADLGLAGHRRPDDQDRRRRGRRAAGDRRQGRRGSGHRDARPTPSRTTSPGSRPTALQGKRIGVINNTNAQYVAAIAAIQALGATTVQIPTPSPAQNFGEILTAGVQARPQRVPVAAARERADEVAGRHHRLQHRERGGGAEVRPDAADREPGRRPQRPGADGGLRRRPRRRHRRHAHGDRQRADHQQPRGDHDAVGDADRHRRARRLPADRRPGGLQRGDAGPVGIAFNGTAYSEAKLLAFAYAYEQATKLRKTPSEINPAAWRCYSGAPRACAPGREVATGVTLDFPLETATVRTSRRG